jgi:hypothetical protein
LVNLINLIIIVKFKPLYLSHSLGSSRSSISGKIALSCHRVLVFSAGMALSPPTLRQNPKYRHAEYGRITVLLPAELQGIAGEEFPRVGLSGEA